MGAGVADSLQVGPAGPVAWREVTAALAAAFEDDPVFGWLIPRGGRRAAALRRFFDIETRRIVLRHERSVAAAHGGATIGGALVLPPGRWRSPLWVQGVFGPQYARIFGARLGHALGVITAMERHHPREAHVYFPYIGVVPGRQGEGVGAALMRPVLERCDREGMPAYLEASNPRCARLYERLGFAGTEEIRPLGSPPLRLMWREPGAGARS
jgi:GNAT superfamily N-acetyltransferase